MNNYEQILDILISANNIKDAASLINEKFELKREYQCVVTNKFEFVTGVNESIGFAYNSDQKKAEMEDILKRTEELTKLPRSAEELWNDLMEDTSIK